MATQKNSIGSKKEFRQSIEIKLQSLIGTIPGGTDKKVKKLVKKASKQFADELYTKPSKKAAAKKLPVKKAENPKKKPVAPKK